MYADMFGGFVWVWGESGNVWVYLVLIRAFGASWISQGLFGDVNDSFFVLEAVALCCSQFFVFMMWC